MKDKTDNRHAVIATAWPMHAPGLNQGMSGKVPIRHEDGLRITAASRICETMATAGICVVGADGQVRGIRAPSSNWRLHCDFRKKLARQCHRALAFGETPLLGDVQIEPVIDMVAGHGLTAKDSS